MQHRHGARTRRRGSTDGRAACHAAMMRARAARSSGSPAASSSSACAHQTCHQTLLLFLIISIRLHDQGLRDSSAC